MFSLLWCITWIVLLLTSSVGIVTINVITIIVFVKNRALRKRSTYLLTNLAVVDMLVGGFSVLNFFIRLGIACELWKLIISNSWPNDLILNVTGILFPVCSILNITVISVERFHATFWPFRHRIVKPWVYWLVIAGIWVTSVLLSAGLVVIRNHPNYVYLWCSFNSTCLLVISVSYAFIVFKVRCGAQPQHHGAASRERKLTMTLSIVTVVSLLIWFPYVLSTFLYFTTSVFSSLSNVAVRHISIAMIVLYFANSLVNPIVYTHRMPEFRRALVALFRKRPQQLNQAEVIPLHDM